MPSGLTAPGASPWDLTPSSSPLAGPHRPGLLDVNKLSLIDDPTPGAQVTDPAMPSSALLNTVHAALLSIGRVVPNARVSVTFVAGTPGIVFTTSAATAVQNSPSTYLNVIRTPSGGASGDIFVCWLPNTFPAQAAQHKAGLNGTLGAHNYAIAANALTVTPAAWQSAHAYSVGNYVVPVTAPNGLLYFFKCTSVSGTGTSAGSEPTWPTAIGATVTDNPGANQVVWTCMGGTTGVQVTMEEDAVLTDLPFSTEIW